MEKKKKFFDADLLVGIVGSIIMILYAIFIYTGGPEKARTEINKILPIKSTEWVNLGPIPTESPWK